MNNSKRISGFDMAPPATAVLPGSTTAGMLFLLFNNSLLLLVYSNFCSKEGIFSWECGVYLGKHYTFTHSRKYMLRRC